MSDSTLYPHDPRLSSTEPDVLAPIAMESYAVVERFMSLTGDLKLAYALHQVLERARAGDALCELLLKVEDECVDHTPPRSTSPRYAFNAWWLLREARARLTAIRESG